MEKIPTAEEFLNGYLGNNNYPTDAPDALTEFAKLHVKAALEAAQSKANIKYGAYVPMADYYVPSINKESILNAYPLTNIK